MPEVCPILRKFLSVALASLLRDSVALLTCIGCAFNGNVNEVLYLIMNTECDYKSLNVVFFYLSYILDILFFTSKVTLSFCH